MAENVGSLSGQVWAWILRNRRKLTILSVVLLSVVGPKWYENTRSRSVLVQADTGTLHVTLTSEMNKTFLGARVCRARAKSEIMLSTAKVESGCNSRTHDLSAPPGETFAAVLPKGTELTFSIGADWLAIRVISVPDEYAETDVGKLLRGGLILEKEALTRFGSLSISGLAVLGAGPIEADGIPLTEGNYQINGDTPSSALGFGRRILKTGEVRSGAQLFFCRHDGDLQSRLKVLFSDRGRECLHQSSAQEDDALVPPMGVPAAQARLQISIPDPDTSIMRVTAISDYAPVDLTLLYFRTDPVVIGPTIIDSLGSDPVVLLMGALGGVLTLLQFLFSRPKRNEENDKA